MGILEERKKKRALVTEREVGWGSMSKAIYEFIRNERRKEKKGGELSGGKGGVRRKEGKAKNRGGEDS